MENRLTLLFLFNNNYYKMLFAALFGAYNFVSTKIYNYIEKFTDKHIIYLDNKKELNKNIFLFGEYTVYFVAGLFTFWNQPWFFNLDLSLQSDFNVYTISYYYLYATKYICHFKFLNKSDKDYHNLYFHHVVTLSLLGLSFWSYNRIGIIIAVYHDLVDIFLLGGKISNKLYENFKCSFFKYLSYVNLICFIISWVVTRMGLNSYILFYLLEFLKSNNMYLNILYLDVNILVFLLMCNLIVQFIWQYMIINFVYRVITNKEVTDQNNEVFLKKE